MIVILISSNELMLLQINVYAIKLCKADSENEPGEKFSTLANFESFPRWISQNTTVGNVRNWSDYTSSIQGLYYTRTESLAGQRHRRGVAWVVNWCARGPGIDSGGGRSTTFDDVSFKTRSQAYFSPANLTWILQNTTVGNVNIGLSPTTS